VGKGWSTPRPGSFNPWKDTRYQLYRRPGGVTGPAWTGAENLTPTGIWSPGRPARTEALYRLCYRDPPCRTDVYVKKVRQVIHESRRRNIKRLRKDEKRKRPDKWLTQKLLPRQGNLPAYTALSVWQFGISPLPASYFTVLAPLTSSSSKLKSTYKETKIRAYHRNSPWITGGVRQHLETGFPETHSAAGQTLNPLDELCRLPSLKWTILNCHQWKTKALMKS
jgi:hypothetical protein